MEGVWGTTDQPLKIICASGVPTDGNGELTKPELSTGQAINNNENADLASSPGPLPVGTPLAHIILS